MTDDEIIEALDCCTKNNNCNKCPMYKKCEFFYDKEYVGIPDILTFSLDLIRKQKEKIYKLENGKKL